MEVCNINILDVDIKNEKEKYKGRDKLEVMFELQKELMQKYSVKVNNIDTKNGQRTIKDLIFCTPGDSIIYGPEVKLIREMKIGDLVLTHKGTFEQVTNIFKRYYKGKLIILELFHNGSEHLRLTPEHPVYTRPIEYRERKIPYKFISKGDNKQKTGFRREAYRRDARWMQAKDIQSNFEVWIPTPKKRTYSKRKRYPFINLRDFAQIPKYTMQKNGFIYCYRTHKDSPKIPLEIPLNPDLMRLFGYYIAEGFGESCIHFSFNINEREYIADTKKLMKKYFNLDLKEIIHGNCLTLRACSRIVCSLFLNLFGHLAPNKHMPKFYLDLDDHQLSELLKGYWRGDGSIMEYYQKSHRTKSLRVSAGTTSKILAYQLKISLLRLGIFSKLIIRHRQRRNRQGLRNLFYTIVIPKEFHSKFFERVLKESLDIKPRYSFYKIVQKSKKGEGEKRPARSGIWIPVKNVKQSNFVGDVYNLEVNSSQSYVMNGVSVHNCIVEELFEASNCLKNRVWTQTEPVTDMNHFLEEISDALLFFIEFLIATGLTPEQVFELYLKKHQVNQFRIESKY